MPSLHPQVGDWGRQGNDNQQRAARLMGAVAACKPPKFIVSTGDNFYSSGLSSADDPEFTQSFTSVYVQGGLQVPWYAVLGNHDYGDTLASGMVGSCKGGPLESCRGGCCFSPMWQVREGKGREGGGSAACRMSQSVHWLPRLARICRGVAWRGGAWPHRGPSSPIKAPHAHCCCSPRPPSACATAVGSCSRA